MISNNYNNKICNYINTVNWLEDDLTAEELNDLINPFESSYDNVFENVQLSENCISNKDIRKWMIDNCDEYIEKLTSFKKKLMSVEKKISI